eukprot:TRINITY_DN1433_c0_g1_i10.p1 TRINITY_DN1433_c0_g1~~TRINITY_DN1433_c0_g1_i10.p1  ORF type:complete len:443 (-),score=192.93 TRINITY_DN1433_c0_g1_i10:205-1470(-)
MCIRDRVSTQSTWGQTKSIKRTTPIEMRTQVILCLALVLGSALAFNLNSHASSLSMNKKKDFSATLEAIQNSRWGPAMLSLGQLHAATGGALDSFFETIDDLVDQLQESYQKEEDSFEARKVQHEATVMDLKTSVNQAEYDIASTKQRIENRLLPERNDYETALDRDGQLIEENKDQLDKENVQRKAENDRFQTTSKQHQEAIEAIDEALDFAEGLLQDESSLVQVSGQMGGKVKKVANQLKKGNFPLGSLVSALVEMSTSQTFEDKEDYRQVIALLNQLRAQIVSSLQTLEEAEENAADSFEDRIELLQNEIDEAKVRINENAVQLSQANAQIDQAKEFLEQREADLEVYKENLDRENETFRKIAEIHDETLKQYLNEIDLVKQVTDIFEDEEFTDYVVGQIEANYIQQNCCSKNINSYL